jgi:ABC-2 type transport system ATP-binding protein
MPQNPTVVLPDTQREHRGGFQLGPIDMELSAGITVLVGPNGAGKSTLMRLCAGLDQPTGGDVVIDGQSLRTRRGQNAARLVTGYLQQDFTLPRRPTSEQFLHYVAWLRGVRRRERADAVDQALSWRSAPRP